MGQVLRGLRPPPLLLAPHRWGERSVTSLVGRAMPTLRVLPQAACVTVRGPSDSHAGCSPAEQEVGSALASLLVGVIGVRAVELLNLLSKLTQCHE